MPTQPDEFGDKRTNTVVVNLGRPSLQILDHDGNITFSAPFTGSNTITRKSDGRTAIKTFENVKIVITANLSVVQGTTDAASRFTPGASPNPSRAGAVRIVEQGGDAALGICIDFPALLSVVIEDDGQGGNTPNELDRIAEVVKASLERKFRTAGFQYCLAGVNNKAPANSGDSFVLRPARFSFSVIHGDDDTSAICMGILLEDNHNAGSTPPPIEFTPKDSHVNPIPTGRTASVIFGHRVMANSFIVPGLIKSLSNVKCVSEKGDAGMRFEFKLPSHQIMARKYEEISGEMLFNMDGFSFNLDSPVSNLVFSPTNSSPTPPVKLSYTSPPQTMEWNSTDKIGLHVVSKSGVVEAEFSLTGTASWGRGPNPERYPNQLQLLFTFAPQLGVKIEAKKQEWWKSFFGGTNALPPHARDMDLKTPAISIDMTPMDYFLTTNLLFPGEHIFHVDDPSQTTEMQGLMTPRDTILTGMVRRK
ncbi:hypothetical protein F5144DRAFT_569522 [Chaetomium tenue]|uniref:Uncharacterized protein n=1 Tax=Chaetomium tenue TaxID=1854479 RepID=A0ACB7PDS9_9PEZI|nr:hypothetical protein F5144DRAFT_569522 [Chaetomium globosum]